MAIVEASAVVSRGGRHRAQGWFGRVVSAVVRGGGAADVVRVEGVVPAELTYSEVRALGPVQPLLLAAVLDRAEALRDRAVARQAARDARRDVRMLRAALGDLAQTSGGWVGEVLMTCPESDALGGSLFKAGYVDQAVQAMREHVVADTADPDTCDLHVVPEGVEVDGWIRDYLFDTFGPHL